LGTLRLELPTDIYLPADAIKGAVTGVQAFRMRVQSESGRSEDHYVIDAQHHRLHQRVHEVIATYLRDTFGECVVSFILVDLPGKADVLSVPQGGDLFRAAAAVAVVKAACGWDENNPMIIRINNSELEIALSRDDQSWITRSANARR
jgi:hypothetical protein